MEPFLFKTAGNEDLFRYYPAIVFLFLNVFVIIGAVRG